MTCEKLLCARPNGFTSLTVLQGVQMYVTLAVSNIAPEKTKSSVFRSEFAGHLPKSLRQIKGHGPVCAKNGLMSLNINWHSFGPFGVFLMESIIKLSLNSLIMMSS